MTVEELLVCGFVKVARWQRDDIGDAVYEGNVPSEPGIYLLAVKNRIHYVGSSLRNMRERMDNYQRKQRNRVLSRPVHVELAKAVDCGEEVAIYVRPIPRNKRIMWSGLPVNVILGIVAALVADFSPQWNQRGRKLVSDEEAA